MALDGRPMAMPAHVFLLGTGTPAMPFQDAESAWIFMKDFDRLELTQSGRGCQRHGGRIAQSLKGLFGIEQQLESDQQNEDGPGHFEKTAGGPGGRDTRLPA